MEQSSAAAEHCQNVVSCLGLTQPGKNLLDAVTMRVDVAVRHRIHDQHNVVAMIIALRAVDSTPALVETPMTNTWVTPRWRK